MIPIDIGLNSDNLVNDIKKLSKYIEQVFKDKTVKVEVESNAKNVATDVKSIPDKKKVKVQVDSSEVDKVDSEIKSLPDKASVAIDVDSSGLNNLKDSIKSLGGGASESLGGLFDAFKTGGILGAGIAAASIGIDALSSAIGGLFSGGNELNNAFLDLQNKTGLVGKEFENLKQASIDAFKGGVGGSIAEATKVMGEAQRLFGDVFDTKELTDFTVKAQTMANMFDKDVNEILLKSSSFVKQFGLDGLDASNLIAYGFKNSKSAQDDFLDSLSEYSQLAVQAGHSAESFTSILVEGTRSGAFNTDKLADALKEAQIRLKAGDTQKALKDFSEKIPKGLLDSISNAEKLARTGQISLKAFMTQSTQSIEESFNSGEITEAMRSQLQIGIAGTPAEDLGTDLYARVYGAPIPTDIIQKQAQDAGNAISKAAGQYTSFGAIGKDLSKQFQLIGLGLVQFVNEFITPFVGAIFNGFKDIGNEIEPLITSIIKNIKPLLDYIQNVLGAGFILVWTNIKNFLSFVFNNVFTLINELVLAFKPLFQVFNKLFDSVSSGSNIFTNWIDIISVLWDIVKIGATILIQALVYPIKLIVGGVTNLVQLFVRLFSSTKDVNSEVKKSPGFFEILLKVLNIVKGVLGGLQAGFSKFLDIMSQIFEAITNFEPKKVFNLIMNGFGEIGKAAEGGYKKATESAKNSTDEQIKQSEKLKSTLQTDLDNLGSTYANLDEQQKKSAKIRLAERIKHELAENKISEAVAKQMQSQLNQIGASKEDKKTKEEIAKAQQESLDKNLEKINNIIAKEKEKNEITNLQIEQQEKVWKLNQNNILTKEQEKQLSKERLQNAKNLYDVILKTTDSIEKGGAFTVNAKIKESDKSAFRTDLTKQFNAIELMEIELGLKINPKIDYKALFEQVQKDIEKTSKEIGEVDFDFAIKFGLDSFNKQFESLKVNGKNELNQLQNIIDNGGEVEKQAALLKYKELESLLNDFEYTKYKVIRDYNKKNIESSTDFYTDLIKISTQSLTDVISNFKFEVKPEIDEEAKKEAIKGVEDVQTKIRLLKKGKDTEGNLLSYEQIKEQEQALNKELEKATEELEKYNEHRESLYSSSLDTIKNLTLNMLSAIEKHYTDSYNKQLTDYNTFQQNKLSILQQTKDLELEIQKEFEAENYEIVDKLMVEREKLTTDYKTNSEKADEAIKNSAEATIGFQIAALGELALQNKITSETMINLAFETMNKLIPYFVLQIFGKSIEQLGPLAGPLAAAGLTAILYGLKAAVGAEDGVVGIQENYSKKRGKTDTIPLWVAKDESIINAKNSKKHKPLLELINSGASNKQLSNYFINENGKLDNKVYSVNKTNYIENINNTDLNNLNKQIYQLRLENKLLMQQQNNILDNTTLVKSVQNVNINNTNKIINTVKNTNHRR